jgi:hypothetical protein
VSLLLLLMKTTQYVQMHDFLIQTENKKTKSCCICRSTGPAHGLMVLTSPSAVREHWLHSPEP